jgi:NADH:ubiquinone oxidoreductase subunit C
LSIEGLETIFDLFESFDEPRLKFEMLTDISGVDYLEPDPKKVAKAGFEPHIEVVYHLSSFTFPGRRFTVKVILPRWKENVAGQLPEVPTLCGVWRTAITAPTSPVQPEQVHTQRRWCGTAVAAPAVPFAA